MLKAAGTVSERFQQGFSLQAQVNDSATGM